LPSTEAWTTVIDRVIAAVAVPVAQTLDPTSPIPEHSQQTGDPQ
jgi:hypothetical protein